MYWTVFGCVLFAHQLQSNEDRHKRDTESGKQIADSNVTYCCCSTIFFCAIFFLSVCTNLPNNEYFTAFLCFYQENKLTVQFRSMKAHFQHHHAINQRDFLSLINLSLLNSIASIDNVSVFFSLLQHFLSYAIMIMEITDFQVKSKKNSLKLPFKCSFEQK